MFDEDWWKIEGGVCGQQNMVFSLSLRYGSDCISGKNSDGTTLNQILAQPSYSRYAFHDSTTFSNVPSRIKGVIPEH